MQTMRCSFHLATNTQHRCCMRFAFIEDKNKNVNTKTHANSVDIYPNFHLYKRLLEILIKNAFPSTRPVRRFQINSKHKLHTFVSLSLDHIPYALPGRHSIEILDITDNKQRNRNRIICIGQKKRKDEEREKMKVSLLKSENKYCNIAC